MLIVREDDDSLFFKMSVVVMDIFLFILFLPVVLEVGLLAATIVEVSELFEGLWSSNLRVVDKGTMVKGNQGQNLVHFFFPIVGIHVVCTNLVLVVVIFDDPIATSRQEAHGFSNSAENVLVYYYGALGDLLLALNFDNFGLLLCLHGSRWAIISENIIFLFGLRTRTAFGFTTFI